MTPEEQSRAAAVVFEGFALPGPAVHGVLVTPARFRITRYLKGDGPGVRLVATGIRRSARGSVGHLSTGILPAQGEHWRIFGGPILGDIVGTSVCAGSGPTGIPSTAAFTSDQDSGVPWYGAAGVLAALVFGAGLVLLRRRRHGNRA
jgi:LPXTG-motif cell wall-anchored protein